MKWHTQYPEYHWRGERRLRRMFAFLPHRCSDGMTHWFEDIMVEEEYLGQTLMGNYWVRKDYHAIIMENIND